MRICISSSIKYEKDWPKVRYAFRQFSGDLVFPEVKNLVGKNKDEIKKIMVETNSRFYKEIDRCDLLYVYCPDGYIGKGVSAEIGYALAKKKEIISSDMIEDVGISALITEIMNPKKLVEYVRSKGVV